jgi:hypothetical protein
MARRRTTAVDPFADLSRKLEILEQEMAAQRVAIDKLKSMGAPRRPEAVRADMPALPARKTA